MADPRKIYPLVDISEFAPNSRREQTIRDCIGMLHGLLEPKTKTVWFVTGGVDITNQGDGLTLDVALNLARAKAELGYTVTLRPQQVPAD